MRILFVLFVFAASQFSAIAQENFVHIDNYTWIDNDGEAMVGYIDAVISGDADVEARKSLNQSVRHVSTRFESLDRLLIRTDEQKNRRAMRFANYEEYVSVHRANPEFVEINMDKSKADVWANNALRMKAISEEFRTNKFHVYPNDEFYSDNVELLKEFRNLYLESVKLLNDTRLN